MEFNETAKLCRLIVPVSGRETTKMGRGEKPWKTHNKVDRFMCKRVRLGTGNVYTNAYTWKTRQVLLAQNSTED